MNQLTPDQPNNNMFTAGHVVYYLFLAVFLTGFSSIIGLIMAYMNKDDCEVWVRSHYDYQIRTFFIGLLYFLTATVLTFVAIGYILYLVLAVWLIVRCLKGLKSLNKQQPIEDATRWGF